MSSHPTQAAYIRLSLITGFSDESASHAFVLSASGYWRSSKAMSGAPCKSNRLFSMILKDFMDNSRVFGHVEVLWIQRYSG